MKHKRLNRDGRGFQYYPYYQMRINESFFHGIACLIRLNDGAVNYWETPKAGRIQVKGDAILRELCGDILKTYEWCAKIRQIVEDRITNDESIKECKEVIELRRTKN